MKDDTETRVERATRFSKIWWQSRADSGKSQEYMALGLGVSKKTIQNWERGITSPSLFQSSEWFRLLGLNPMHYYLEFLYPWAFEENQMKVMDEAEIDKLLIPLVQQTTVAEKQQLLYLMSGSHGSSWYALLQMFTAHCHTTMQSRAAAAQLILDNYEIERENEKLICPETAEPDLRALQLAISQGKNAAKKNEKGYTTQTMLDVEE